MLHAPERGMDTTAEQNSQSNPTGPEKGVPPTPKPDVGKTPDLINPEQPDAEPKKPMPDMDPAGQDPDENDIIR
jgi:hypothetical protein